MWLPTFTRPLVIYTPDKFSRGSSFSHVDDEVYFGMADYIMRRFEVGVLIASSGTPNVLVDEYQPVDRDYGVLGGIAVEVLHSMGYVTR
jgi:hypothetical protein